MIDFSVTVCPLCGTDVGVRRCPVCAGYYCYECTEIRLNGTCQHRKFVPVRSWTWDKNSKVEA